MSAVSELDARRIEECALNATGPFQSLAYDGWLLGYRRGRAKRLRCINTFYPSALPLEQKIAYCAHFYDHAGLPALFRISPFSRPDMLDATLERMGWRRFDHTAVMRVAVAAVTIDAIPAVDVQIIPAAEWTGRTAALLGVDAAEAGELTAHADGYPLPQVGAIVCRDDAVVAGAVMRVEGACAGLFSLATKPSLRGQGLGRAVVAALLGEAARYGVRVAYLQVTSTNVPARSLYSRFGFVDAYDYWYRSRTGEDR
jgi:ribosomal protein S18 acetylase RimI-like enzyme